MLKILVVDESRERASEIGVGLIRAGYQVAAVLPSAIDLAQQVETVAPDVILIDTESPSRDTLEHLATLNRANPRPVLLFSRERDAAVIRSALRAGVAAYVAETVAPEKLASIVEVALVQFEQFQKLRQERDEASRKLAERVVIERAKGVLMKTKGMEEDAAYHALRKLAMERGKRIVDIAQGVLDSAALLL
ncbi:MAG: ANTAR domain-containing protein [Rhodocyclaceae bacterium]|nr:ANTAR domain-containing protein [Rhodocyclaceae bacterium]MBX3668583.1 ANTAR domain-containing protein [Rhodocyclaceae bacterium]